MGKCWPQDLEIELSESGISIRKHLKRQWKGTLTGSFLSAFLLIVKELLQVEKTKKYSFGMLLKENSLGRLYVVIRITLHHSHGNHFTRMLNADIWLAVRKIKVAKFGTPSTQCVSKLLMVTQIWSQRSFGEGKISSTVLLGTLLSNAGIQRNGH